MRTDETLLLNTIVNGKQPSVADRIYFWGGCNPAVTSGWLNWVLLIYDE